MRVAAGEMGTGGGAGEGRGSCGVTGGVTGGSEADGRPTGARRSGRLEGLRLAREEVERGRLRVEAAAVTALEVADTWVELRRRAMAGRVEMGGGRGDSRSLRQTRTHTICVGGRGRITGRHHICTDGVCVCECAELGRA